MISSGQSINIFVHPVKLLLFTLLIYLVTFIGGVFSELNLQIILGSFMAVFALIFLYQKTELLYFLFVGFMLIGDSVTGEILGFNYNYDKMANYFFLLTNLFGFVTFFSFLINKRLARYFKANFKIGILELSLLIFLFLSVISTVSSSYADPSVRQLYRYIVYVLFYFLTFAVINNERIFKRLIVFLCIIFVFYVFISFYKFLFTDDAYYPASYRIINFLPFVIALYSYLAAVNRKALQTLVVLAWALLGTFATFFSESRRSVIGVSIIWLLKFTRLNVQTFRYLIFVVIGVYIVVNTLPQPLMERLQGTEFTLEILLKGGEEGLEQSGLEGTLFTERNVIWAYGFQLFLANPIFGVGMMNSQELIVDLGYMRAARMHNLYLQILVDMGIAGILSYLFIIFIVFYYLSKTIKIFKRINNKFMVYMSYAIRDYYIAVLIIGFFGAWGIYDKIEWFIYGIVAASFNLAKHQLKEVNEENRIKALET